MTKKLKPVGIEAIARGYLIGSGWKDYQRTGKVSGIQLPDGLQEAEKLPDPIFTPSTKAAVGHHDENIDFDTTVKMIGAELAERVRTPRCAFTTSPPSTQPNAASYSPIPSSNLALTLMAASM